jgi:hypothetical protein
MGSKEIMIENEMRPAIVKWLNRNGYYDAHECWVEWQGICDVIGCLWTKRFGRAKPDLLETICIELKMRDIRGVISQSRNNHPSCNLSYCAMPADFCHRMKPDRIQKFIDAGVGLLAVDGGDVEIIIYSNYNNEIPDERFRNRMWNFKLRDGRRRVIK